MSFKDQGFGERWQVMGDPAENAYRRRNPNAVRTGLDRAKTTKGLTAFERYEPDFRKEPNHLERVECMGIGQDQTLKIKLDKMYALVQWDGMEETELYVWDSHKKRDTIGRFEGWFKALAQYGVYAVFPEGKPYLELHARYFPYGWTKAEATEEDEAAGAPSG